MMKQMIIFGVTALIAIVFSSFCPGDSNRIDWNENVKLKWSDFTGKPGKSERDAVTSYNLSYKNTFEGKKVTIVTSCFFTKNESWVKEGKDNAYLLNHEQGHFDIAEICARKIRKEFSGIVTNDKTKVNAMLQEIYHRIFNEFDMMQDQYDDETEHSKIEAKQKQWDTKIQNGLKAYKAYKETTVLVLLK